MCARSTRRCVHLPLAVALALFPALSFAQIAATEDNPLLGTWTLLVEKSRYKPGPPPQRQTRTYEAAPHGVKTTIRTVTADGESTVHNTSTIPSNLTSIGFNTDPDAEYGTSDSMILSNVSMTSPQFNVCVENSGADLNECFSNSGNDLVGLGKDEAALVFELALCFQEPHADVGRVWSYHRL
jgi:hypothetical protein